MGNVIGKIFDIYVKNQIKIRQKKLASTERSDKDLQWLNNKTAFLRLSSSVNIRKYVAESLGYPNLFGNGLAKKMILWGGVRSGNINKN